MADLRRYELGHFLGVNSDPDDRLTTSLARVWWPTDVGGNGFEGDRAVEELQTDHLSKGALYSIPGPRNQTERSITGPIFPETAGTLVGAAGYHSDFQQSSGLPRFLQIGKNFGATAALGVTHASRPAGWPAGPVLGEIYDGCIIGKMAVNFEREATTTPLSITLSGYLNADRAVLPPMGTSVGDYTAFGAISVDMATGATTNLRAGEFVLITDADNSTSETVKVTAITDADTFTCTTTVALNGSGATALTIAKVNENSDLALYPALDPYLPTTAYIDVEIATDAGVFSTGWTGDNEDVQSVSIEGDQALAVKLPRPNTDTALDTSWTKVVDGRA